MKNLSLHVRMVSGATEMEKFSQLPSLLNVMNSASAEAAKNIKSVVRCYNSFIIRVSIYLHNYKQENLWVEPIHRVSNPETVINLHT